MSRGLHLAIDKVRQRARELFGDGERIERSGVTIYKHDQRPDTEAWVETLETVLPVFREAGWTEGVHHVEVGDYSPGQAGYAHDTQVLNFDTESRQVFIEQSNEDFHAVECSPEQAVLHEFIHHVHRNKLGEAFDETGLSPSAIVSKLAGTGIEDSDGEIAEIVGEYAVHSPMEFVAEVGTGITHGVEYPDWILESYDDLHGPEIPEPIESHYPEREQDTDTEDELLWIKESSALPEVGSRSK